MATEQRFTVDVDSDVAELVYEVDGDRLYLTHTRVPSSARHKGVGGQLVTAAIERARDEELTIVPLCSYTRWWLLKNPDRADGVAIDWHGTAPR